MKMLGQKKTTRYIGAAISVLGLAVIALGVFFVTQGFAAKSEIQAALIEEQVTTTVDEVKVPVTTGELAMAQADLIKSHTLGNFGPWSSMERDDPNRATMLDGLTLRNSLTLARMALDVSDLVAGLGAVIAVIGVAFTATGAVIISLASKVAKQQATKVESPVGFEPGYEQAA